MGMLLALAIFAKLGVPYSFCGTPLSLRVAPPLELTRASGGTFNLVSRRGHAALVYFGYTYCPDVCPATLIALRAVFTHLGASAPFVDVVFVTLDPGRDTAQHLYAYLQAFDPVPIGLTGSARDIAKAAADWGVRWRRVDNGAFIDHTSVITLVDSDDELRVRYGFSQLGNPAGIARDIQHVLASTQRVPDPSGPGSRGSLRPASR